MLYTEQCSTDMLYVLQDIRPALAEVPGVKFFVEIRVLLSNIGIVIILDKKRY